MSLTGTRRRTNSFVSNTSSGRSSTGSVNGRIDKLPCRTTGNDLSTPGSTQSTPTHSLSSKLSSGYLSDVRGSCSSFNFSEWASDYQLRQRSPYSKNILADIKEKLLKEIENVEFEMNIIEIEKQALLNVRIFVVNFRALLDESGRNSQGLLVADKLKNIVDKTVSDIGEYDEAIQYASGIPFSDDLRTTLHELRDTLSDILRARSKLEHIEGVFSRCGRLLGVVDTILLMFYEHTVDFPFLDDHDEASCGIADATFKSTLSSHSGSQLCGKCFEEVEQGQQGSGLFDIDQRTPKEYDSKEAAYSSTLPKHEELKDDLPRRSLLEGVSRQVRKMLSQLKSIERMTSGRPKMKYLISKFQELDEHLNSNGLESIENYSLVLEDNLLKIREVMRREKPGQHELDEVRYLLSQLAGRTSILFKLEKNEGSYQFAGV